MSGTSQWEQVSAFCWRHPRGYQVMQYLDGIVPRWSAFHPSCGWFCTGVLSRREAVAACRAHATEDGHVG